MKPVYIDNWMCDELSSLFPKRGINKNLYRIRRYNRYIQMATAYHPHGLQHIHYEICSNGYIELHIEGKYEQKWADIAQSLYIKTRDDYRLTWSSCGDYPIGKCRYEHFLDEDGKDFVSAIKEFTSIIDPLLDNYKNEEEVMYDDVNYDSSHIQQLINNPKCDEVSLADNLSLNDIFHLNIKIPDYQRIYSWEEKNVRQLLDDIFDAKSAYRMGALILHHHDDDFDIIDGQQRLITLSLILRKLGYNGSPLLNLSIKSSEAMQYVAYNRFIIDNYISGHVFGEKIRLIEFILRDIQFSVLILNSDKIDLAYTFFSNENSRGKILSDFDLLKAHHLRYVNEDAQAEHLAKGWDKMLSLANESTDENLEKPYYRALGLYVFRLRNWMRMNNWDDFARYNIKHEYEAAPIIDEIPPFGERFYFNESIQGGTHFFAFVKQFEYRYKMFH